METKSWMALGLTLLMGCASLTPERIDTLVQIALQAAQAGAQLWLSKHPEHRAAFDSVIRDATRELAAGDTKKAMEILNSLPTRTMAGPDGELYVSGDRLVVWDADLKKSTAATGTLEEPVMRATLAGLRRAVTPVPPMPNARAKRGMATNSAYPPDWKLPPTPQDAVLDAEFEAIKAKQKPLAR